MKAEPCRLHGMGVYLRSDIAKASLCACCVSDGLYREDITQEVKERYPEMFFENVEVTCRECGTPFVSSPSAIDRIVQCPHGHRTIIKPFAKEKPGTEPKGVA